LIGNHYGIEVFLDGVEVFLEKIKIIVIHNERLGRFRRVRRITCRGRQEGRGRLDGSHNQIGSSILDNWRITAGDEKVRLKNA
jgi:hypothetical protein